jgi:hypothetical protein
MLIAPEMGAALMRGTQTTLGNRTTLAAADRLVQGCPASSQA